MVGHPLVGRVAGEAVTRLFVDGERRITPFGPAHGADPMGSNPPYALQPVHDAVPAMERNMR
jgi:hypothetical protein